MNLGSADLDTSQFPCEDDHLVPFACPRCQRLMVTCDDCDVVYADLANLADTAHVSMSDSPVVPAGVFSCPSCGFVFHFGFAKDPKFRVNRDQWERAGLASLLRPRSAG
jgi:hypothetical protein